MTPDEWVRTINQLIAKTRAGKVTWKQQADMRSSQAAIGDYVAAFGYVLTQVGEKQVPQAGSLALQLCNAQGKVLDQLTESIAKSTPHPADEAALRSLFDAIVVEPRERAVGGFTDALDQL